jgi:hypothetical protein
MKYGDQLIAIKYKEKDTSKSCIDLVKEKLELEPPSEEIV